MCSISLSVLTKKAAHEGVSILASENGWKKKTHAWVYLYTTPPLPVLTGIGKGTVNSALSAHIKKNSVKFRDNSAA